MFNGFYDVSSRFPSYRLYGDGLEFYPFYKDDNCPVEVLQGHWEFPALLSIYKKLSPLRVVEIGSLLGGTLWYWIQNAPKNASIISIDLPLENHDARRQQQKDSHEFIWKQWADQKSVHLTVIPGSSHDPEIVKQVGPIDFLFIDGDHSYEGVKKDFCDYGPLVRAGGIIALHDILWTPYWTSIEVNRLWDEIKAAGYITQELYVHRGQLYPTGAGVGIGVVYL